MKESMFNAKDAGTFHRRFLLSPEIIGYFAMSVIFGIVTAVIAPSPGAALWPMVTMVILYPVAEYLLHRYLLHANFLAKSALTSPLWYRVHYRHHSKPSDQSVILAAPYTIVGAVAIIGGALALAIGSWTAFTAGLAVGGLLIIAYEYAHSVCHSAFPTENRYLKSIRTNHVLHHFHSESGNYGITNEFSDVLFGTRYDDKSLPPRSRTVRNLGYDEEMREAFPWIAQIEAGADSQRKDVQTAQQGNPR
jgi:sterol desaturase/sphingolipid hydroxylase (fatty acid hydroxylase superfamily)